MAQLRLIRDDRRRLQVMTKDFIQGLQFCLIANGRGRRMGIDASNFFLPALGSLHGGAHAEGYIVG